MHKCVRLLTEKFHNGLSRNPPLTYLKMRQYLIVTCVQTSLNVQNIFLHSLLQVLFMYKMHHTSILTDKTYILDNLYTILFYGNQWGLSFHFFTYKLMLWKKPAGNDVRVGALHCRAGFHVALVVGGVVGEVLASPVWTASTLHQEALPYSQKILSIACKIMCEAFSIKF